MPMNLWDKLFPAPKFFVMPSFGLDISDESIKFVELVMTTKGLKVKKYGEKNIPAGTIESGKIKNAKKLEEILKTLKEEEGIKAVRVSLPEEQVYVFKLKLDKEGLESIRERIELSLEEHIPISAPDTIFDYEILDEDPKYVSLQVAAIPKKVIEDYLAIFKNVEIRVKSFELEAQAIARAVLKSQDKEAYMLVDFGKKRTGIFIVYQGLVIFTSTLDVGGEMLNEVIKKNFKVSKEEAEKMKKEYGLSRNKQNAEIFPVLLNCVSILRDEVMKHFLYWHTHKDEDGKDRPQIKKVILCGGDSNLIGLAEYLSVSIKTEVEVADVWTNILDVRKYAPEITLDKSIALATAVGLALRDFNYD